MMVRVLQAAALIALRSALVEGWVSVSCNRLPSVKGQSLLQNSNCFKTTRTSLWALHQDVAVEAPAAPSETVKPRHQESVHFISTLLDGVKLDIASLVQQLAQPNAETKRKILNFILLATSFGYAAYTILNINHDMTRGWTSSEIAMRIPFDTWSNYESSLAEEPVYTKTMINVVIYLLGDWLSQTVFQGKNVFDFDAGRTLKNGFIGLCFGPLVHEYYEFSDRILPIDGPNPLLIRLEKITMDQTIYLSVKASIYVAAVALLAGESWETAKTNVKERIAGIVFTAWKFWPLVHCLTYTVIPAQHRILWVNCVDLFWNAILASMSRVKKTDETVNVASADEEERTMTLVKIQELPYADTSVYSNSTDFGAVDELQAMQNVSVVNG